jgi:hypothetical protein
VLPSELAAVPWPALLVSANGAVLAASPTAVALLGMNPNDIDALEDRFELLSTSGQPVAKEEHPLHRATRGELFQVGAIWRDRDSGRELSQRSARSHRVWGEARSGGGLPGHHRAQATSEPTP